MTDDVTTAAARLAEARAAHNQAVERHGQAVATAARARDRHEAATRQRQEMLASASAGGNVTEDDLKHASVAEADARDTLELHRSIAAGALNRVHAAEIDVLVAMVADHGARTHAARVAAGEAAEAVDAAVATARTKLAYFQDRLADLRTLADEAVQHNAYVLPEVLTRNAILAGQHPSTHPKVQATPVARAALAVSIIRDGGNSIVGEGAVAVHSVVALVGGTPAAKLAAAPATETPA